MIVIVIIGVLAAIAVPATVVTFQLRKGPAKRIVVISTAAGMYYIENNNMLRTSMTSATIWITLPHSSALLAGCGLASDSFDVTCSKHSPGEEER